MATVNVANISQLAPTKSDNARVGMLSSPSSATVFNDAFSRAHQQLNHSSTKSGNSMPSHASVKGHSEPAKTAPAKASQSHRATDNDHVKNTSKDSQTNSKTTAARHNSTERTSASSDDGHRQVASDKDSRKAAKNGLKSHPTDTDKAQSNQPSKDHEQIARVKKNGQQQAPVSTKDDSSVVVSEDESRAMQLLARLEKAQNADMQLEQTSSMSDKLKLAMQVLEQAKKLSASKQLQSADGKQPSAMELALMMLQKVQSSDAKAHLDTSKSADVSSLQLHQTLQMLNQAIAQSKSGKSHYAEHLNQLDPKLRKVLEQLSEQLAQVSSMDEKSSADQSDAYIEPMKSAKHQPKQSDDDATLLSQLQAQLTHLLNPAEPKKTSQNTASASEQNQQPVSGSSGATNKMVQNVALLALAELKMQHLQNNKQQSSDFDTQSVNKLADKIAALTAQLSHLVSGEKTAKDTAVETAKVSQASQIPVSHIHAKETTSAQNIVQQSSDSLEPAPVRDDIKSKATLASAAAAIHNAAAKASATTQSQTPAAQSVQQALAQNPTQQANANGVNGAAHGQTVKDAEQAAMIAAAQSGDNHAQHKAQAQQQGNSTQLGAAHLAANSEISLSAGQQHAGLGAQSQHQGGAQLGSNNPLTNASKNDGSFASQLAMNQPSKLSSELNERINYMVSNKLQSADIRLDPGHLGAMQIRLNLNHDQAQVQIHVHNPQAREMLEQSMPKLRDMLAQQGIQLGQSQINQGNSGNPQQQGFAQTGGQSQGGFAGQQPFGHSASEVVAEESLPHLLSSQLSTDDGIDYYA
ncbi:flagellar hook-length control protein FliK [Celerinatantimonas sp. MCCC 1A17872]|uniref:flagellar hook-length control protein FliK n=1 Tax=Celerinatantimonas sp. MCCC 1A17872 TaxID=3177514 RepID=UPI0038C95DC1